MWTNFEDLSGHVQHRETFDQVGVGVVFVLVPQVPVQHAQVEVLQLARFGLILDNHAIWKESFANLPIELFLNTDAFASITLIELSLINILAPLSGRESTFCVYYDHVTKNPEQTNIYVCMNNDVLLYLQW